MGRAVPPASPHWTMANSRPNAPNPRKQGFERLPRSAQDLIGATGRRSFQPSHQHSHRDFGQNPQMHVVGHHHPCTKFVELPLALPDHDGMSHEIGNLGVPEPQRSGEMPIQGAVLRHEDMAGRGVDHGIRLARQGGPQPPGQEQISTIGLKMCNLLWYSGIPWSAAGETAWPAPQSSNAATKCAGARS